MINALKLGIISLVIVAGFYLLFAPPRHDLNRIRAQVARDYADVPRVSTSELSARLSHSPPPLLLDVRTPEEYRVSHLPGAMLVAPGTTTRELREVIGPREAVLYCTVGQRASELARQLLRTGQTNVSVLDGSIFQWILERRPLLDSSGAAASRIHPHSSAYVHLLPAELQANLSTLTLWTNRLPPETRWRWVIGLLLLVVLLVWESLSPAFAWFKNPRARLTHGWRNYTLGFINIVFAGLLFAQLWLFASRWADLHQFGLFYFFQLPGWARLILGILILDLFTYSWHWLNHHHGILWRFHRTHHSETALDVTSAVRFHFGELTLSALLRIPLIVLLGLRFHELLIYELVLFALVQFHHANISLSPRVDRALARFIVTPNFHRIHHSAQRQEADSNYSSILTIWDRLFGTRSNIPVPSRFGVGNLKPAATETVVGMVESPLDP